MDESCIEENVPESSALIGHYRSTELNDHHGNILKHNTILWRYRNELECKVNETMSKIFK